ncbi:helix-turn-helix domain-containing protein [Streptomyces sp. NPDC006733]|uniref:helix-turn-helix domain-containing protein n=1 Tax=Streptomyces sp. NPDC006733 TaxID=3155460 RepID=UPI0033C53D65
MHPIVFDTVEVPVADRPAAWVETMALAEVTQRVKFLETARFNARMELMPLGVGQLSTLSYASLVAQRTPKLVRQSDPEMYHVAVATGGEIGIDQHRQSSLLRQGDMGFFDSSRPFDTQAGEAPGHALLFQFPKGLLRVPHERFTALCGLSRPWTHGVGRMFGQFLVELSEQYPHCTPHQAAGLGATAVDLLMAVLTQEDDAPGGREPSQQATFVKMSAFVTEHLADPHLGPEMLAAAHHISLRYLHRVFQHNGTTPRTFIREQRMGRCRRDLADPALRHLTINAIAGRWGYPHPAAFARSFRSATGMSATEYRTLHAAPAAQDT